MANKVEIIGGDFPIGEHYYFEDTGYLMIGSDALGLNDLLMTVDIVTEKNQHHLGKKLAGGIAGGLLLGPVGAIGGMLYTGNTSHITVAMQFYEGQSAIASVSPEMFQKLKTAALKASSLQAERELETKNSGIEEFDKEEFHKEFWRDVSPELVAEYTKLEKSPDELGMTHADNFRRLHQIELRVIEQHPGTYACEMFKEGIREPDYIRRIALDDAALEAELREMENKRKEAEIHRDQNEAYPLGVPKYLWEKYQEASKQMNVHPPGSAHHAQALETHQILSCEIVSKYPDSEFAKINRQSDEEFREITEQALGEEKKGFFSKLFS